MSRMTYTATDLERIAEFLKALALERAISTDPLTRERPARHDLLTGERLELKVGQGEIAGTRREVFRLRLSRAGAFPTTAQLAAVRRAFDAALCHSEAPQLYGERRAFVFYWPVSRERRVRPDDQLVI